MSKQEFLQFVKNSVLKISSYALAFSLGLTPAGFSQQIPLSTSDDKTVPAISPIETKQTSNTTQEPKDFFAASPLTPVESIPRPPLPNPAPTVPVLSSEVPAATNQNTVTISGTKTGNTSIWLNGVEVIPVNESTSWSLTLNLTATGKNNFSLVSKNSLGKASAAKKISIIKDLTAPTGSVSFTPNSEYTTNEKLQVTLSAKDANGIESMRFSTDGGKTWGPLTPYQTKTSCCGGTEDGKYTVHVKFYDKAGNESAVYSDSIMLDTKPPVGTISVRDGQATNKYTMVLDLAAQDSSGIKAMRFSQDGGKTWTTAEPFFAIKLLNFTNGSNAALAALKDGVKTIMVKFQDNSGKWSDPISTSVILDRAPPTLTINAADLPKDGKTDVPYFLIPYQTVDGSVTANKTQIVELQPGVNSIVLSVKDLAGNETKKTVTIEYRPEDANLTPEERAQRDQYLRENFAYFTTGQGIDAQTGFPIDVIGPNAPAGARWSQPTSIGFYLGILGEVIAKRLEIPGFSQADALAAAAKTLASLRTFQSNFGWNGLIPWVKLDPNGMKPDRDEIAFIDNANLTAQIASFIGVIEKGNWQHGAAAAVYSQAKSFIDAQAPGYQAFVDTRPAAQGGTGTFYSIYTYNRLNAGVPRGFSLNNHAESFGLETRGTVPFLVQYYNLPSTVWTNLKISVSGYPTAEGRTVKTFTTFDGGAFQYFWALFTSPEESLPKISGAMQNALAIFTDIMKENNLTGFPSAASIPGGYAGNAGINYLKENSAQEDEMIGAVYALAAAYRLNPSLVLAQLKQIEQIPGMKGALGFFDSSKNGVVSQNYYAIDQGSIMLGLLGTGADNMKAFLEKRNKWTGYQNLYAGLNLDIPKAPTGPLTSAEIAARTPASGNLYDLGYSYGQISASGIAVTQSSPGIYTYTKTAPTGFVGGFVNPAFNRNDYDYVEIEVRSLVPGGNQVRLELKDGNNYIVKENLNITGTDWQVLKVFMPKTGAAVNFIALADPASNFEVRRIGFTDVPPSN